MPITKANVEEVANVTCKDGCTCEECMSSFAAKFNLFDIEISFMNTKDEDYPF